MILGSAVAVVVILQTLIGPLIHHQRQMHLAAAFQHPKPVIADGDAMGVVQVAKLGINEIVIEGIDVDHLRGGPARAADGALPGDPGVLMIAGHRSGYGGPFARLAELAPKDEIVVQARSGPIVKYVVDRVIRNSTLASVDLGDEPRSLAYLLLVTSEGGLLGDAQTIVVARALPLSDRAAVVPSLGDEFDSDGPLSIDALLGNVALLGGSLAAWYLRGRVRLTVAIGVAMPMLLFGVLRLAFATDAVLSLTR